MNSVVLKLRRMQGRLNKVGGDLGTFCDDLDQVCEVIERLETICGSWRKFERCSVDFKKVKWRCSGG